MEFLSTLNKTDVRQESSLKVTVTFHYTKVAEILNLQYLFSSETFLFSYD